MPYQNILSISYHHVISSSLNQYHYINSSIVVYCLVLASHGRVFNTHTHTQTTNLTTSRLNRLNRLPDGSSCQVMSRCNGEPEFAHSKWWVPTFKRRLPSINSATWTHKKSGTRNWKNYGKLKIWGQLGRLNGLDLIHDLF